MNEQITRHQFIRNSAKIAAGIAAGVGVMGAMSSKSSGQTTSWPWPYAEIDAEEGRIRGHLGYYARGCSYGAYHAIVSLLSEKVGAPYTTMPTEFLEWGRGGAWSWGTLCGALTGALTAINLCQTKAAAEKIGNELIGWYCGALFPSDVSNQYAVAKTFRDNRYDKTLPQSSCGSPLCHASVSTWCTFSKFKRGGSERSERCGRLTGDVAAYSIKLMNDELKQQFKALYTTPAVVTYCMTCHGPALRDDTLGKMTCRVCHGDHTGSAPPTSVTADQLPDAAFKLHQNYPNPFNPSTTIRFSIPKDAIVSLIIYDIHGRAIKNLISYEDYGRGSFEVHWDGRDNANQAVPSGTYFAHLFAGTHSKTIKLSLNK